MVRRRTSGCSNCAWKKLAAACVVRKKISPKLPRSAGSPVPLISPQPSASTSESHLPRTDNRPQLFDSRQQSPDTAEPFDLVSLRLLSEAHPAGASHAGTRQILEIASCIAL